MNFEGKTCGNCNKGTLKAFKDEVAPGIQADAYKCNHCGNTSYPRPVMEKIEAMHKASSQERHLVKVGSSVAAPIPSSIVKELGLKIKESVFIRTQGRTIIIQPSPT
jgi:hypothetical protein